MGTRYDALLPSAVVVVEATSLSWEAGLLAEEARCVAGAVKNRVREFTAGRNCARQALSRVGICGCALPVGTGRAPVFPPGFCGTITHTENYCAAAVARSGDVISIGIDAETNTVLPEDILALISLPAERSMIETLRCTEDRHWGKLLFSIKEAFFKAYFPVAQRYLEFREALVAINPQYGSFSIGVASPDVDQFFQRRSFTGYYRFDDKLVVTALALLRE